MNRDAHLFRSNVIMTTTRLDWCLGSKLWRLLQDVINNAKIDESSKIFANESNMRLQSKIQEAMANYARVDAALKVETQEEALRAKSNILNLHCPHCKSNLTEFTGCMALQCQTCHRHSCGYCHGPSPSSRDSLDHVRQCILNDTSNGSYYTTGEEITRVHRRYKTRELKQFLLHFERDLQNAIVVELSPDLNKAGIQPDGLFELGNLHDDYDDSV